MQAKRLILVGILGAFAGLIGTAAEAKDAKAKLFDIHGQRVGTVWFQDDDGGVVAVRAKVNGLTPGFHGFHVHENGECIPPFTSAGFHFQPGEAGGGGTPHPSEAGDMPVLLVNADGSGEARFQTDRFSVADILDRDGGVLKGSAIIIHALPDNYSNIPTRYVASPDATTLNTGDAGGRVACGVVENDD